MYTYNDSIQDMLFLVSLFPRLLNSETMHVPVPVPAEMVPLQKCVAKYKFGSRSKYKNKTKMILVLQNVFWICKLGQKGELTDLIAYLKMDKISRVNSCAL